MPADEALRRSYWVAKLLHEDMGKDKLLAAAYADDDHLCAALLAAFRPGCEAWIPHISMVLTGFLRAYPDTILGMFEASAADCAVHFDAICGALHHPLVPEMLQDVLCLPTPKPGQALANFDPQLRTRLSIRLAERGVLRRLVVHVVNDTVPFALADAAAETFAQTLKRISSNTYCVPLSNSLKGEAGWMVEELLGSLRRATVVQRQAAKLVRMQSAEKERDPSLAVALSLQRAGVVEATSAIGEAAVRLSRLSPTVAALVALATWVLPETVEVPSNAQYQSFGGTIVTMTDNQLYPATAPMLSKLIELCDVLFDALLDLPGGSPYQISQQQQRSARRSGGGGGDDNNGGGGLQGEGGDDAGTTTQPYLTRHPGHVTAQPFSQMRLNLVRLLFAMIKADSAAGGGLLEKVPVRLWQRLSQWLVEYPHTNMYHNLFVDLFSLVLASDCEPALRAIIKRPKKKKKKKKKGAVGFLSRIIRHYQTSGPNSSVRGHIIKCLNLVRLKVLSLAPESFLSVYIRDLQDWREFLPTLLTRTRLEQRESEFYVPKPARSMWTLSGGAGEDDEFDDDQKESIGLNSPFADSLGLGHLKRWRGPVESVADMDLSEKEEEEC